MGKYMIRKRPKNPGYNEVFGKHRSIMMGESSEFAERVVDYVDFEEL